MNLRVVTSAILAAAGSLAATIAVVNERKMHRHRLPDVSYARATFRRDGGWRRSDFFTRDGLRCQRVAARFGLIAAVLWVLALGAWIGLAAWR